MMTKMKMMKILKMKSHQVLNLQVVQEAVKKMHTQKKSRLKRKEKVLKKENRSKK